MERPEAHLPRYALCPVAAQKRRSGIWTDIPTQSPASIWQRACARRAFPINNGRARDGIGARNEHARASNTDQTAPLRAGAAWPDDVRLAGLRRRQAIEAKAVTPVGEAVNAAEHRRYRSQACATRNQEHDKDLVFDLGRGH